MTNQATVRSTGASISTNTSTNTCTCTLENASIVQTLFDLFYGFYVLLRHLHVKKSSAADMLRYHVAVNNAIRKMLSCAIRQSSHERESEGYWRER